MNSSIGRKACQTVQSLPMQKRSVDIVVLSDIHLGTYGCHAIPLLRYLRSINPGMLILNGDIIDMWQFKKNYWPAAHMHVIRHLTWLLECGTPIYYLPGNHDEMLRRFAEFNAGNLTITNKLRLNLHGERTWIFHGDVFDITMRHTKWLARMGSKGYDLLILLNRLVNRISEGLGQGRISLSKRIKSSMKQAIQFIRDFEQTAIEIAREKGYHTVICGHIHQPANQMAETDGSPVRYLNSGDWVEHLTALEYNQQQWELYHYHDDPLARQMAIDETDRAYFANTELFEQILREFYEARPEDKPESQETVNV